MIARTVNNKTAFRRLLSSSRLPVTGDRTASRLDPNPGLFDPATKYFMLFLISVFTGLIIVRGLTFAPRMRASLQDLRCLPPRCRATFQATFPNRRCLADVQRSSSALAPLVAGSIA
jgi:hypothetical protein